MTDDLVSKKLHEIRNSNAYRTRLPLDSPQGVYITINGQRYLSFCSNDYLGLANDPRVCHAATEAIQRYGVGSGASQFISGYSAVHAQLEEQLAAFLNYPRCILFSSGYLANLGTISTFAPNYSYILQDKLNHASIIDAARYSGSKLKRYRHQQTQHASAIVRSQNHAPCLIVTDGVFSMEGTIAPLRSLVNLKHQGQHMLMVDDAHGIGVLGRSGLGSLEHNSIPATDVDILIGTFGKAFGVSGAFVAGSDNLIEFLLQQTRTLIYTTALPTALAAAAQQSLKIIINEPQRRDRLNVNIDYFRRCAQQTSLQLLDSITAIQSLIIGDNEQALVCSNKLRQQGILALAIRPPTVPKNSARIRITLSSEHTHEHIDRLISCLTSVAT